MMKEIDLEEWYSSYSGVASLHRSLKKSADILCSSSFAVPHSFHADYFASSLLNQRYWYNSTSTCNWYTLCWSGVVILVRDNLE